MSFYGNSYYYKLADAFSTVLLKNLGLNRADVTSFPEEFELIESGKREEIHAENTESNLEICSGNQWIQIGRSKVITNPDTGDRENKFCIMHGPPAIVAQQPGFESITLAPGLTEAEITSLNPTPLGYNSIIAVPVVKYDPAGHIVVGDVNSKYYQMPTSPKIELEDTFDVINDRLKNITGSDEIVTATSNGLIKDLDTKWRTELGLPYDSNKATDRVKNMEETLANLNEDIKNVKEIDTKFDKLMSDYQSLTAQFKTFQNTLDTFMAGNSAEHATIWTAINNLK